MKDSFTEQERIALGVAHAHRYFKFLFKSGFREDVIQEVKMCAFLEPQLRDFTRMLSQRLYVLARSAGFRKRAHGIAKRDGLGYWHNPLVPLKEFRVGSIRVTRFGIFEAKPEMAFIRKPHVLKAAVSPARPRIQ